LKRIYSSFNRIAVHHARNLLDAAGIRAVVKNEYLSSAMGDLPPAECQAEVWLLDERDLARAQELLFNRQPSGEQWACAWARSSRSAGNAAHTGRRGVRAIARW
jgi:hypothetical protein